jgi:peptide deformylase
VAEELGQIRRDRARERDPEAEARRQIALAQIRQYGDPVLRMQARDVESFDDDLARLLERMKLLMADASGVGLAGNQVGILQRLVVVQPSADEDAYALVNPRIVARSEQTEAAEEGCLSLQGVLVPVERSVAITVEARDERGGELRLELEELAARVVQHELDHLDGVLILDRTTDESRREALSVLRPRLALS